MSCELGRGVTGADVQSYDWGFEIAMNVRKLQSQLNGKFCNNSLDEGDSCNSLLRSRGSLIFCYLFPRCIVGTRLSHFHDVGAVTALHFDVAGLVCYTARDAYFRICHGLVSVRANTFIFAMRVLFFSYEQIFAESLPRSVRYRKSNKYKRQWTGGKNI